MVCGKALVNPPAGPTSYQSGQPLTYRKPATVTRDPAENAKLIGGFAGIAGGVICIIGFLMPWSNAVLITFSGLQFMLGSLTASIAALGMLQYSSGGWILVLIGLLVAIAYALILILGALCIRTGVRIFEYQVKTADSYVLSDSLDQLRSRSKWGITVMVLVVLVPLLLGALLTAALPFLAVFGQLGNLLPNSGYGSGLFITVGGFVLAYIGTRFGITQLNASDAVRGASSLSATNPPSSSMPPASLTVAQDATGKPLLTDIEKQVLSGLAQGLGESDIALRLAISDSVVSKAISDLYTRLNVTSRSELVSQAKQAHLL
jgi:DNA-binding CsgD family transcriptional regulator